MLLEAAALVIGTVIAMSNHTLPWLPREHPRKASSVPLSLLGGGTEPWQLLSSLLQGKLRHGDPAVLSPRGVLAGWGREVTQ